MNDSKPFKVAIYNHHNSQEGKSHINRPLAYLRYFSSRACVHVVSATNGIEAKRKAIREHKDLQLYGCDQLDEYCCICQNKRRKKGDHSCFG